MATTNTFTPPRKPKRKELTYFDGINAYVGDNIAKISELCYADNCRSTKLGTVEKRAGCSLVGASRSTSTDNWGLAYFKNDYGKGLVIADTISNITHFYYLNNTDTWTAIDTTGRFSLGNNTTTFTITKAVNTVTYTPTFGLIIPPNTRLSVGDSVVINGQNFNSANNGTFIVTDVSSTYFSVTNASGEAEGPVTIGTGYVNFIGRDFSFVVAENCLFAVNGSNLNHLFRKDAAYYYNSDNRYWHLFQSPKARKIAYYKNRLYLADYYSGNQRQKNKAVYSSAPVGIVSLIEDDQEITPQYIGANSTSFDISSPRATIKRYAWNGTGTNPQLTKYLKQGMVLNIQGSAFSANNKGSFELVTVAENYFEIDNSAGVNETGKIIGVGYIEITYVELAITETRHIYAGDYLQVKSGGSSVGWVQVSSTNAKKEGRLRIERPVFAISSGSELWVQMQDDDGDFNNNLLFRWPDNTAMGTDVKEYDTFAITSLQSEEIKIFEPVGDVLVIGSNNHLATWNDYSLQELNYDIGCISDLGYVKKFGSLFFVHYTGIYSFDGSSAPQLISAKIQPFIDGASKSSLETSRMSAKGYSIFTYLGDVTLYKNDGSIDRTLTSVTAEYNILQQNWYIHSGLEVIKFVNYQATTDATKLVFVGTNSGRSVYELFSGTSDFGSTEIPWNMTTSNLTLGSFFENLIYLREIIVEVLAGSGIKAYIALDGEEFYPIKSDLVKGINILKVTKKADDMSEPSCNTIKLSLREISKGAVKIGRIAIIYDESLEKIYRDDYGDN
jgi:hypothetical protein